MSDKYVLALDAGSGGGRAFIIDLRGNIVSSASQEWGYDVPDDASPMGKEFDAGRFWDIICQLIAEAVQEAHIASADIIAASAASQREGMVFLDKDGHELYAGPNVDLRAIVEGFAIDGDHCDVVHCITGHTPSLLFAPAKLRWFEANRPHIYERISTVLSISDWIIFKLSGERVGEVSSVCDLGLFDIRELGWSGQLAEMLRLPQHIYPEIAVAGTQVGETTRSAAEQTGLVPGTTVVAGGADTQCGLLGMGVRDEGQVGIVAGWSGVLQMVTAEPVFDSEGRIWTSCHALPGKWILESNAQECGGAYRWLQDLLFGLSNAADDRYKLMEEEAQEVPPGAGGVLAFIGPMAMDMKRLRPSMGGFVFPVTPTVTGIERKHLVRAAIENICFAFRANYDQLRDVSRLTVTEASIGGGLAQSPSLVQTLTDVLGMEVTCFEVPQVTSYGIAMCAAVGSGVYPDLETAMVEMRPGSRTVAPDPSGVQEYAALYEKWLSLARSLDGLGEAMW
ncbi:MAG: FGGY family carbohydrate kinase [Dehalococcoidia bacterium]